MHRLSELPAQVIEAHPQHEVPGLRVLAPPAALTTAQYAYVPYIVFLVNAARQVSASLCPHSRVTLKLNQT